MVSKCADDVVTVMIIVSFGTVLILGSLNLNDSAEMFLGYGEQYTVT